MNYTQEQLNKLPKWAKQEIERLTSANKSLESKMAQLNGTEDTNTFICEGMDKSPLPMNASIQFFLGEKQKNKIDVYIRKDGTLDIHGDSPVKQELVVMPRSANSMQLYFVDRP